MGDLGPVELANLAEKALMQEEQIHCPLQHFFAPGVYIRQITMPAGTMIVGQQHKTEHPNVILKGKALVSINGVCEVVEAGMTFISGCGVRKVLLVLEEMVWQTTHCIDTTDIPNVSQLTLPEKEALVEKLVPTLIRPTKAWEKWRLEEDMKNLTTKEAECLSSQ